MKKNFMYAMMSAIALTGAMTFSACQSSDEIVDNPDYNPETNSVKTAITINIGRGNQQTRMASSVTQNNGKFRGMYNVYIYPALTAISGSSSIDVPVVANDNIGNGDISSSSSNKTYSNKQLTIGTRAFLFYGRAGSEAGAPSSTETKLANGFTVPTFATSGEITASNIYFTAQPIAPATLPAQGWTDATTALSGYLNGIISSENGWNSTSVSNHELGQLYVNFTGTALHAGSADGVLAAAQHLYDRISELSSSLNEADAAIAGNVITDIKASPASFDNGKLSWANGLSWPTNFPANLGLPLGAAQYRYNSTSGLFEYVTSATLNAANTAVENFIYPSELFYFTNTPLKETSGDVEWPHTTSDWATASTTWNATSSTWTNVVQATSKNIALVNNIQYGTAQLATYVKSVPDESNKLYDNAAAFGEEANQALAYKDGMFQLTGVIVGSQPSKVGWNFLPSGTTGATYDKCVYDNNVNYYDLSNDAATSIYANSAHEKVTTDNNSVAVYSGPNYTLVYDNEGNATSSVVNVCLEFTNDKTNGVDFYGKDGLIKKGQKFYLIGKLDPDSKTIEGFPGEAGSTNAAYYPSVAYRVFIQDYTTKAFFEISAGSGDSKGSLAHAYSTIPDLRTTNMEIGLSVDLVWKPGLEFTNIVLGE